MSPIEVRLLRSAQYLHPSSLLFSSLLFSSLLPLSLLLSSPLLSSPLLFSPLGGKKKEEGRLRRRNLSFVAVRGERGEREIGGGGEGGEEE